MSKLAMRNKQNLLSNDKDNNPKQIQPQQQLERQPTIVTNILEESNKQKVINIFSNNQADQSKDSAKLKEKIKTEEKRKEIDLNEVFNEENKKVMMDTMKLFQKMQNQQTLKKTDDYDKTKNIEEQKEKLEIVERDNINLKKSLEEREKFLKEKIKSLESQLLSTDKYDIVILQNQNKTYENQMIKLNNQIKNLSEKHDKERNHFNNLVGELLLLKDQLIHEINSIDLVKIELMKHKNPNKKEIANQGQKVEFLLKFVEVMFIVIKPNQAHSPSKSQKDIIKKEEKSVPKLQERHKSTNINPVKMDINSSQIERDESAPQNDNRSRIVRHSKNQLFDN